MVFLQNLCNVVPMSDSPSHKRFNLRLPSSLFDKIAEDAERASRPMNAEIIKRLEDGSRDQALISDFLREEALELEMQIQAMKDERADQSAQAMEYAKRGSDVLAGAMLQMDIRMTSSRLLEAESRLRRIKRVLGE